MKRSEDTKLPIDERVVITGVGLMSPIGASAWDTAKALLDSRSRYMSHETVLVADNPKGSLLRGATISRVGEDLIPHSLTGANRLSALLMPAISQILADLPTRYKNEIEFKIVLPVAGYEEVILNELAQKNPGIRFSTNSFVVARHPRTEFFRQIDLISTATLSGQCKYTIVACADSLCDTAILNNLMLEDRLKDAMNPYGIMASEAAGAILLERESTARGRGVAILAAVTSRGGATEPAPWTDGKPSKALGLTTAFHQAFERLDDKGRGVLHVITDENGERQRALEWALTKGRIFPNPSKQRYLWTPATVAGDAGGALAAIILAYGFTKLIMSTPPGERIAMAVSDDKGDRQVMCIEHVEQPERDVLFANLRLQLAGQQKETEVN